MGFVGPIGVVGPLFRVEARALARRRRTYRGRAYFAGALFVLIGAGGLFEGGNVRSASAAETTSRARRAAEILLGAQVAATLLAAPAVAAGVVAGARRRAILPDLLTTRLSGVEVVVGPLVARGLAALTWPLIALPPIVYLGQFGGLDVGVVLAIEGVAASSFAAIVALTALASVHCRHPRDAALAAYGLAACWLVASTVGLFLPMFGGALGRISGSVRWLWWASPVALLTPRQVLGWLNFGVVPAIAPGRLAGVIEAQLVASAAMLGLAALRLRPASRGLESGPTRRAARRGGRRRPRAVGDDAMRWKERHAAGAGRVAALVVLPAAAVMGLAWYSHGAMITRLFYGNFWVAYGRALDEFFRYGYRSGPGVEWAWDRGLFAEHLSIIPAFAVVPWLVGVAALAAGGIAGERESRTWGALLASPLSSREIVDAKVWGAAWGLRSLLPLVVWPWFFGLAMGATHPVGVAAACGGLYAFARLAAAAGTYASSRCASTSSALWASVAALVGANLAGLIVFGPAVGAGRASWLGFAPSVLAQLPFSTYAVASFPWDPSETMPARWSPREFASLALDGRPGYVPLLILVGNLAASWVAGSILIRLARAAVDREADRPWRRR